MLADRASLWHRAFKLGMLLKGLDGLLELAGGSAMLLTKRPEILHIASVLTRQELIEDPNDFIANHVLQLARHLSPGTLHFAGIYLLAQGIVKTALVAGLLCGVRWTYPLGITLMTAFIGYQGYRLWGHPSPGLVVLTLIDVAVVYLIVREWRQPAHAGH